MHQQRLFHPERFAAFLTFHRDKLNGVFERRDARCDVDDATLLKEAQMC